MAAVALLPAVLAALLLAPAATALAQAKSEAQAGRGQVTGRIQGAPEGATLEGTRVVLLQFRLTSEGVPEGHPIQMEKAGADGSFAFKDVPIEERTVYQVGATVDGQVVGSEPFTFPAGEREVVLNLNYPHLTRDDTGLRFMESLIAVEPRRGGVWVTEVLHLVNPGQDVIDGRERPLELSVPADAEKVEFVSGVGDTSEHERLGAKLLVYGNLEPGRTTIAFRYRLPVWLGTVSLEKRYPHPVGALSVLAPEGNLRLEGSRFQAQDAREIEGTRYDTWLARDIPASEPVMVRIKGLPVRQEVYLLPAAVFFVLMIGIVVWFLYRRLPAETNDA